MSNQKVAGQVEVSLGDVRVVGVDGLVRTVTKGDFIYEGEKIVSDDSQAMFKVKYQAVEEITTYEGVFVELANFTDIDTLENTEANDVPSDIFETEAGQDTIDPSSGFFQTDFQNIAYQQTLIRTQNDEITLNPDTISSNFNNTFDQALREADDQIQNNPPSIDLVQTKLQVENINFRYENISTDTTDKSNNGQDAKESNLAGVYTTADDNNINLGTYAQKTIAVSFTTATVDSNDGFQVIYEQGGTVNGYSVSMVGSHAYAFIWGESYGIANKVIDLGELSSNSEYSVSIVHDSTAANGGTMSAYINDTLVNILDGVGKMGAHSGDVGIGGYINDTVHPITFANISGNGGKFSGSVDDLISWNDALTQEEIAESMSPSSDGYIESSVISIQESVYDSTELFSVSASDIDDNPITFSLDDDFGGLFSIDTDGKITVDGLVEYDFSSNYDLVLRVTDSLGASVSETLTVNVQEGSDIYSNDFSLQTDGVLSSKVNLGNNFVGNKETVETQTISLWFKKDAVDSIGNQIIYEEGGGTNGLNIYFSGNTLYAGAWEKYTGTWFSTDVADTDWHHVVLTYDGSSANEVSVTLDKVALTTSTGSGVDNNNDNALAAHPDSNTVGGLTGSTRLADESTTKASNFKGDIDNLRVYEDALDSKAILTLNNEGITGSDNDDILEYTSGVNFDGGLGIDTLIVSGSLDLSSVVEIKNIEEISLETGASIDNGLDGISVADIISITGSTGPIELLINDLDNTINTTSVHVNNTEFTEINTANTTDGVREFAGIADATVMLTIEDTITVE